MMLIPDVLAQAQGSPPGSGGVIPQLIFLAAIFLIFYFVLIRPQRKKQKEHSDMITSLDKGDEVITSGGILGRINIVDQNYISLQVAKNVEIRLQKVSVHAVLPKGTLENISGDALQK